MLKIEKDNTPPPSKKIKVTKKVQKTVAVPAMSFAYVYQRGISRTGAKPKYASPAQMEGKIVAYFDSLLDNDGQMISFPTITGLALFLGFSDINQIYSYEKKAEFKYLINRARLMVTHFYETQLTTKQAAAGAIFALKNLGWKDAPTTTNIHTSGPVTVVGQLAWDDDDQKDQKTEDATIEIIESE